MGLSAVSPAYVVICDPHRGGGAGYFTCGVKPGSFRAHPAAVCGAKWSGDVGIFGRVLFGDLYGDRGGDCPFNDDFKPYRDPYLVALAWAGGDHFRRCTQRGFDVAAHFDHRHFDAWLSLLSDFWRRGGPGLYWLDILRRCRADLASDAGGNFLASCDQNWSPGWVNLRVGGLELYDVLAVLWAGSVDLPRDNRPWALGAAMAAANRIVWHPRAGSGGACGLVVDFAE